MTRVLVASLALLAGCGGPLPTATTYVPPSGQRLAANPPGVPTGTPNYLIDGRAGANIPLGAYGITTNGTTWYLEWQGEVAAHHFTGDVYCPVGCIIDFIEFGANLSGGTYNSLDASHFHFDVATAADTFQHLEFDATRQPVTFDLKIDGQAATNPHTTFPSGSQLATTELMPFNLISSNAAADMF